MRRFILTFGITALSLMATAAGAQKSVLDDHLDVFGSVLISDSDAMFAALASILNDNPYLGVLLVVPDNTDMQRVEARMRTMVQDYGVHDGFPVQSNRSGKRILLVPADIALMTGLVSREVGEGVLVVLKN